MNTNQLIYFNNMSISNKKEKYRLEDYYNPRIQLTYRFRLKVIVRLYSGQIK